MESFVLEVGIIVPELHMYHYEVVSEQMEKLLSGLPPAANALNVSVVELRDLLYGRGEIASLVRMQGKEDAVRHLVNCLGEAAWRNDLPATLYEASDWSSKEAQFLGCNNAHLSSDEDPSLEEHSWEAFERLYGRS